MSDEIKGGSPVELTPEEQAAKVKLDKAVQDLQKAAIGTQLQLVMGNQLLIMQVDALIDLLAETKVFERVQFWERITKAVEALASECRRAVLSQGGASALAGLKRPA